MLSNNHFERQLASKNNAHGLTYDGERWIGHDLEGLANSLGLDSKVEQVTVFRMSLCDTQLAVQPFDRSGFESVREIQIHCLKLVKIIKV